MLRHVVSKRASLPLTSLLRQMHIISGGDSTGFNPNIAFKSTLLKDDLLPFVRHDAVKTLRSSSMLLQARSSIQIPMQSVIRPSIGIPPEMLRRSEYKTPSNPIITPLEIPTSQGNQNKEIQDSPDRPRIEKQAARLIVIRRSKMNKHKLRKLRKKMKYVWAKVRLRRAMRKEKEYLNSKMELINSARSFDAKEYVAGIIARVKEVETPVERRWNDPLMPEWYKEQELKKIAQQKRYQKVVNLYLNKSIYIDYKKFKRY